MVPSKTQVSVAMCSWQERRYVQHKVEEVYPGPSPKLAIGDRGPAELSGSVRGTWQLSRSPRMMRT